MRLHSLRSEEHTSELQSRLHLVCRLLLEKTNKGHPPGGRRHGASHSSRADPPRRRAVAQAQLHAGCLIEDGTSAPSGPLLFFFLNEPRTPEFYPLPLQQAFPI